MTVAESIAKAVDALPPEKQYEALNLIRRLGQEPPRMWISPEGIAGNIPFDMSLEEFQSLRHEMWGSSTDDEAR
jgi:hypothetical protein